jgi:hypothetical protein
MNTPQPAIEAVFKEYPKIARLNREVIITEKIDGTNAQILISDEGDFFVGSRTRWITPEQDNHGFARWAYDNKEELLKLGPGRHFGEWWGSGIQRGYGLPKGEKRLSLFNVTRWCLHGEKPNIYPTQDPRVSKVQDILPECVGLVPVLGRSYSGFDSEDLDQILGALTKFGSYAARGFMDPEGIVAFHNAANIGFKVTLKNDDLPKILVQPPIENAFVAPGCEQFGH